MIRRSTWILVVVCFALIGFAYYFNNHPSIFKKQESTATPAQQLFSGFQEEQITKINVIYGKEGSYTIIRNPDNSWGFIPEGKELVDQGKAEEVTTTLSSLQVLSSLSSNPPEEVTGLNSEGIKVTLSKKDGTDQIFLIGKATPTDSGYYVRLGDQFPAVIDKNSLGPLLMLLKPGGIIVATPTQDPLSAPGPVQ